MTTPTCRLIVNRLDFTNTINVMLDLCARHLPAAPTVKQRKAVEDVIFCLNTALNSINTNGAAALLNTRPATPLATATPTPASEKTGLGPQLSSTLLYIRTHPDCRRQDIETYCATSTAVTYANISSLRKAGYNIIAQGRPANYRLEE